MDLSIWEELRDRLNLTALGKPTIIGIAALLAMVAVFAGKNIIETATASDFQVERAEAQSAEPSAEEAPRSIFVHVSGAVNNPGLVEVSIGSRVADAVQAAGGFTDDAVVDSVNLARALEDGEQVFVAATAPDDGNEGDDVQGNVRNADAGTAVASQTGGPSAAGKVNLNTASESELESLPGIGPSTAAKIVSDRVANGSYKTVDELTRVSGIGEKKLEAIRELVCV